MQFPPAETQLHWDIRIWKTQNLKHAGQFEAALHLKALSVTSPLVCEVTHLPLQAHLQET